MKNLNLIILVNTLLVFACQPDKELADTLYHGGDIITINGDSPEYVEALVVKDGKIAFVGQKTEALKKYQGQEIDLKGKTLLPGFIDPHSHIFLQSAKFSCVNLDPHPIGDVKTIADIQRKLSERIKERNPEPGSVVIGWGYDDTGLEEMRHPNRGR